VIGYIRREILHHGTYAELDLLLEQENCEYDEDRDCDHFLNDLELKSLEPDKGDKPFGTSCKSIGVFC
jgi:hypothetical protein